MAEPPAVNTSPLLYLARANLLDLLKIAGPEVAVPSAVADEIRAWPTADAAAQALDAELWLRILPPEPVPAIILAWDLGPGEAAVLAWGYARPGVELVLDDLAARRCAAALDLPVRGTLGLVLTAKKRGLIPEARPVLQRLHEAACTCPIDSSRPHLPRSASEPARGVGHHPTPLRPKPPRRPLSPALPALT